jgi:hypothetical protein
VFDPRVDATGYSYGLNAGMVGLGAENSIARVDNVGIQVLPPEITYEDVEDFEDDIADIYTGGNTGDWSISAGRYEGTPATTGIFADSLTSIEIGSTYLLRFDATLRTDRTGGIIFDRYADNDFKFAAISSLTNQVMIGHYTERHGWTVDVVFNKNILANKDYDLTVTLKGSTVSVYLDDQALLGYVFNAVTVDGEFGLLSKDGESSFDEVIIATNDPGLAPDEESLFAADIPETGDPAAIVDDPSLDAAIDAAIQYWADFGLVSDEDLATLESVTFEIADLDGLLLGSTSGTHITIDINAAGYGWFIDTTLFDSSEYTQNGNGTLVASAGSDAEGMMDLLTVVIHEMGHVLGFEHTVTDDGETVLMASELEAGYRILPGYPEGQSNEPLSAGFAPVESINTQAGGPDTASTGTVDSGNETLEGTSVSEQDSSATTNALTKPETAVFEEDTNTGSSDSSMDSTITNLSPGKGANFKSKKP